MSLINALKSYKQCDEDGVMCKVSRQAVHEAIERIEMLEAQRQEDADLIAAQKRENERLREDAEILRAELKEYKLALEDARSVIKEAVERIKPLWPFVMTWLPDTADRQTEDAAREVD